MMELSLKCLEKRIKLSNSSAGLRWTTEGAGSARTFAHTPRLGPQVSQGRDEQVCFQLPGAYEHPGGRGGGGNGPFPFQNTAK